MCGRTGVRACVRFRLLTSLPLQLSCKDQRTGHQGQERNSQAGHGATTHANCQFNCEPHPGPLSNHPTKHTQQARTGTGPDGWSGCSTARRYHNSQYLAYTRTVHSTPGLRTYCTYCRSTGRRAQWPFCLEKQASKPCAYVRLCVCTGTQSVASFDFDLAYLEAVGIHTPTPIHQMVQGWPCSWSERSSPKHAVAAVLIVVGCHCQETPGNERASRARGTVDSELTALRTLRSVDGCVIASGRWGWAVCVQMQLV